MSIMYQALLVEGALTKKDKALIMVGLFAARREEKEMMYCVELAVEAGNSVVEISELIASAIISRGVFQLGCLV